MQENGEANGEVKEPLDPNAPKKCDVIVLSGRKERCEAAVEALKVKLSCWSLSNQLVHLSDEKVPPQPCGWFMMASVRSYSGVGPRHHRGGSAF